MMRKSTLGGYLLLAFLSQPVFPAPRQATTADPKSVNLSPKDDIEKAVESHPEGTTFVFTPGTYRLVSIRHPKKGDTFIGTPGAVLNGSESLVFHGEGGHWVARSHAKSKEIMAGAPCDKSVKNADGTPYAIGCTHTRDFYLNDQPLWRVETVQEVAHGKWYFDDITQDVYIADDPNGHSAELGETDYAFIGNASNITLKNLTIEKYATPQQAGAVSCKGGVNFLIQDSRVTLNHFRGVSFDHCDGVKIINNRIDHNGYLGVGGGYALNGIIEGNQLNSNNYVPVSWGWEAGGAKWVQTQNMMVRNNTVVGNAGIGLWADGDCRATTISGNTVRANRAGGIMMEISYGALIENNVVELNGTDTKGTNFWLYYGQIMISASSNAVVKGNKVVVGETGNGITIISQERGSGAFGRHLSTGNRITENTVTYLSGAGVSGGAQDKQGLPLYDGSNVFDKNTYHAPVIVGGPSHFVWNNKRMDWKAFQEAGVEKQGLADTKVQTK